MADNRKYYYLKLKENYFDDDSIVLLESMQDGMIYSNILLKLYGRYQNVMLSGEEISELQSELSTNWSYYVEKLSEYMASTGRQYQSHAATIRRWAAEDMRRQAPQRDYSVKAGDTI